MTKYTEDELLMKFVCESYYKGKKLYTTYEHIYEMLYEKYKPDIPPVICFNKEYFVNIINEPKFQVQTLYRMRY